MARTETVRAEGSEAHSYDGFISYSHAADDLLAPRLQSALQRFAKPWWKRRAVRIFRDESSLSANPHLWSSIAEALDTSGWFVLLLSPDAAQSEWVNQEIAYWVEHRDPKKILPVVTDGTFNWTNGEVTGDAVPDALCGVFSEEPRWVDVRWAKGGDQLDLQDPRFADAVADIASTIRGIPKDDLASEEVRQHRRTVRTAWAAGIVTAVLAVAAVGFGISSSRNADEAERQAAIAATNAEAEAVARQEADRNAGEAQQNAERADAEAQAAREAEAVATAREWAAAAVSVVRDDPELATLLALQAIDAVPDGELPAALVNALWTAGSTNRLVDVLDGPDRPYLGLTPDGLTLAVVDEFGGTVMAMDPFSGEVLWQYSEETNDPFTRPEWSSDGRLAVGVVDAEQQDPRAEQDGLPNRVIILDGTTGAELQRLEFPECLGVELPTWSSDGSFLAVTSGPDGCDAIGATRYWIAVFDTSTWERQTLLEIETTYPLQPRWDDNGTLHVTRPFEQILRFAPPSFDQLPVSGAVGSGDVTPSGDQYVSFYVEEDGLGGDVFSAHLFDAETGESEHVLYNESVYLSEPDGVFISDDGRFAFAGSIGQFTYVYDLQTYQEVARLPTPGGLYSGDYDAATDRLYTSSRRGGIQVWELSPAAVGVDRTAELGRHSWVNGDAFRTGAELVGVNLADLAVFEWAAMAFDPATGEQVGEILPGYTVDGRSGTGGGFLVFDFDEGLNRLWDPRSGGLIDLLECAETSTDEWGDAYCSGPDEPAWYWYIVPDDPGVVWAFGSAVPFDWEPFGDVHVIDSRSGEVLVSTTLDEWTGMHPSIDPRSVAFVTDEWVVGIDPNGIAARDRATGELLFEAKEGEKLTVSDSRRLVAFQQPARVVVVETESWTEIASVAMPARARGMEFDSDDSVLGIGTPEAVFVLDIETGLILQQVNLPGVSDFSWIDPESAIVGTSDGLFGVVSIATDDFIEQTRSRLLRSFTTQECVLYGIDPCPTLDEIRSR